MAERFVNEARFGLSRVLPILSAYNAESLDVIEVGAGTCILSAYLASKGIRQTALEPLGPEFDFFTDLQGRVLRYCTSKGIPLQLVRKKGEDLDFVDRFDVAYTINALEHMPDPLLTIDNMYRSLKSGGSLLAHCPNYTIPFEVHFNIFLVTLSKPLNRWLYQSKISEYPKVWDELNFIRYADMRRHLKHNGWNFAFRKSVMRDLIDRLMNDPIFSSRMPPFVRAIGTVLKTTHLDSMLGLIPPYFQTPMEAVIKKPE